MQPQAELQLFPQSENGLWVRFCQNKNEKGVLI